VVRKVILVFFLIVYGRETFAWSAKGHMIVAAFAKENLKAIDKALLDSVQYFLGDMSFERASVWMDEIKGDKAYDHLKPAHYVNVEKDATYVKNKEVNVINELELVLTVLFQKGPRDKEKTAFALRELFHLVGDLHQPLHAGYGEDRGGNEIDVYYNGESTNLHALWDGGIIQFEKITLPGCLKFANEMDPEEKRSAQKIDVLKWMEESRSYLPFIYGFEKGKISSEYSSKAKPIIEKQLVKAGIRLTAVLFKAFKKGS
jgi:hypothetical protein